MMFSSFLYKGEQILQTVWVGGLLSIGYLAVPVLFNTLDDRRLAGELAGQMFSVLNIVGFVCGSILLLLAVMAAKKQWFKEMRVITLVAMLIIVATSTFILQPMMQALKAEGLIEGSNATMQFGRLHGVSSGLYLLVSLLGIYLVIGTHKPRR